MVVIRAAKVTKLTYGEFHCGREVFLILGGFRCDLMMELLTASWLGIGIFFIWALFSRDHWTCTESWLFSIVFISGNFTVVNCSLHYLFTGALSTGLP